MPLSLLSAMMIIFKETQENTLFMTQKHNLLTILKYLIDGSQKVVFVGHDQSISVQVVTFFFAAWSDTCWCDCKYDWNSPNKINDPFNPIKWHLTVWHFRKLGFNLQSLNNNNQNT